MEKIHARIQESNYTKEEWEAANPVLFNGEKGFVSDDPNLFKLGDGVTAWNSLPWRGYTGTIAQVTGDNENAVMSQKATVAAIKEETDRATEAEEANAQAITDEVTRAKAAEGTIVYDVSAHNNGVVFESLQALLSSSDLSTLIPTSVRLGGMSIRFIQGSEQSSDNKYVQYRLMAGSWSINTNDWSFCGDSVYVENPEWICVLLDAKKRILAGLKSDGSVEWSIGVPTPVKEYITEHLADITENLATKVDKEDGKGLVDSEFAGGISYVEYEFAEVKLDSENKILEATNSEGEKIFFTKVLANGGLDVCGQTIKDIENTEFIAADVDFDNKIHHAISKDGIHVFPAGIKSPTLYDLEKKIPTKEEIKSYIGGTDLLPDSWKESISSIQESQGKNFIFAVQTDTHAIFTESSDGIGGRPNDEYYAANLKSLTNYIGLDFICNLGDIIQGYSHEQDSNEHTRDNMTEIVKRYCSGVSCPMLFCQGNHDSNYLWAHLNNEANIGEAERYAKLIKPSRNTCNNFADNNKSLYFYVDFDDVRVIFLNSQDNGDNSWNFNISETQVAWFSEVALNTTKQIIVASHAPLVNQLIKDVDSTEVTITDVPTRATDILNALYTFKQNKGNVIGCISGHTHYQSHNKINGINHINFKNGGDKAEVVIVDIENKIITTKSLPNGKLIERTFIY